MKRHIPTLSLCLLAAAAPAFAQENPEQVSDARARANFARPIELAADDVRAFFGPEMWETLSRLAWER